MYLSVPFPYFCFSINWTEETLWNYVAITVATLIPLIALRSVRNTLAAPFVIIHDFKDCTFAFPTRFRIVVRNGGGR